MKIGDSAFEGIVIAILRNQIWIKRESLPDLIVKYKNRCSEVLT